MGANPARAGPSHTRRKFSLMQTALERYAEDIAAVIIEPLVQCAGGMRMYDPIYLSLLREACNHYDVHLIADEIAVGFGRTGTMFACEQARISPDFLCLSKGLTGGYLPLSAVLTGETIYEAFYAVFVAQRAFLHSHSYTGNALGCAAARATLGIFFNGPVLETNERLAAHMSERLAPLVDHPHVSDVRQTSCMIAAIRIRARQGNSARPLASGRTAADWILYRHALERGVLLRPIGNVVYFMPPYVITPAEIDLMIEVAVEGIDRACA